MTQLLKYRRLTVIDHCQSYAMERWSGKVAVVTGASAGIGAAICEKLVEAGMQVAGFARRSERVDEHSRKLEGKRGKLYGVRCDITDQKAVSESFQWVRKNLGPVNILVNNAGIFKVGSLLCEEGNPDHWKTVLDTNVLGLSMCSREAFLQMTDAGIAGHIVHINSVAGHGVVSGTTYAMNVYSPSKYAVTCLTEVMRREIAQKKSSVKISSVSPGAVETEIFETSGLDMSSDVMADVPTLKAGEVADAVMYVLGTPPNVQIHELTIRVTGEGVFC